MEGLVLGVSGVAFAPQRCKLSLPLGGVDAVGQFAAGEVELTQLALVLGRELLAFGFPLDGVELVVEGFEAIVQLGAPEQLAQLFRPFLLTSSAVFASSSDE